MTKKILSLLLLCLLFCGCDNPSDYNGKIYINGNEFTYNIENNEQNSYSCKANKGKVEVKVVSGGCGNQWIVDENSKVLQQTTKQMNINPFKDYGDGGSTSFDIFVFDVDDNTDIIKLKLASLEEVEKDLSFDEAKGYVDIEINVEE